MAAKQHNTDMPISRGERANLVLRAELGNATLKVVLFVLDQFAGQKDHSWPSVPTIAACANVTRRAVQVAIGQLRQMGLVEYDDGAVGFASRTYRIDYAALETYQPAAIEERRRQSESAPLFDPEPAHVVRPSRAPDSWGGRTTCAPRAHDVHGGGAPRAPKHNRELNTELSGNSAAGCAGVLEPAPGEPVGVVQTDPASRVEALNRIKAAGDTARRRKSAKDQLISAGVWDRDIPELVELAEQQGEGNPVARVEQVIAMCNAAKPEKPGAWIGNAIRQGWKPNSRRKSRRTA